MHPLPSWRVTKLRGHPEKQPGSPRHLRFLVMTADWVCGYKKNPHLTTCGDFFVSKNKFKLSGTFKK